MKALIRCNFCGKIIPLKELGLKDKDIGILCKNCYDYFKGEFHTLYKEVFQCQ
jgi:hypothetical protein